MVPCATCGGTGVLPDEREDEAVDSVDDTTFSEQREDL
jgi:hypothetical protein